MKKKRWLFFVIILIIIGSVVYFYEPNKKDDEKTTYTNEVDKKNENKIKSANLTLVGDLLFESPFYKAVENGYDKNTYFSLVKKYFEEDDLSIGNMEVVIGNANLKVSGDGFNFCAPEYIGTLVSSVDFEVLCTSNNHAYDRGIDGVFSTIDYFKNNSDIMTVGTYKNLKDRNDFRIKEINGIKFGFLAYTYGTNQKVSDDYKDLIGYYKDPFSKTLTNEAKQTLKNEISSLREKCDVLIVLMHWGIEFTFKPNSEQKEMAKFLNELGVDIIVGSHSHSIQPIEIIEKNNHQTLVYYSLGNFTSQDDDISRTKKGEETFDNAYQFGLLSTLKVVKDNDELKLENIVAKPVINYFDKNMSNFVLVPYEDYNEDYEKKHYRYSYGLTKDFIKNTYESVINKNFR